MAGKSLKHQTLDGENYAPVTVLNDSAGNALGGALTLAFCGEIQGATSATQLPTKAARYVRIKAANDNAGIVALGLAGVTLPNGSTDTTTGFPLAAGEETGWLPLSNLNLLYMICTNTGDDICYWVLA